MSCCTIQTGEKACTQGIMWLQKEDGALQQYVTPHMCAQHVMQQAAAWVVDDTSACSDRNFLAIIAACHCLRQLLKQQLVYWLRLLQACWHLALKICCQMPSRTHGRCQWIQQNVVLKIH